MELLNEEYWDDRYQSGETGWDIGYANPAIVEYFSDEDKDLKILIPGCGNAYEGEELFKQGFHNLTLLDYAASSKGNFLNRVPEFSADQFLVGNFFDLNKTEQFDVIVEQTFFCALNPGLRSEYVTKMKSLLKPGGKLIGVLFNIPLFEDHPPFGGNKEEYEQLFSPHFEIKQLVPSVKSIPARRENELFIEFIKKS